MATSTIPLGGDMPTSFTSAGLTVRTGGTLVHGGYARFGKIVVVSVRINMGTSTAPSGSPIISGFPPVCGNPTSGTGISSASSNKTDCVFNLVNSGTPTKMGIYPADGSATGTVILNTVYICE